MKTSWRLFATAFAIAVLVNWILATTNRADIRLVGPMGRIQAVFVWLVWNLIPLVLFAIGWSERKKDR